MRPVSKVHLVGRRPTNFETQLRSSVARVAGQLRQTTVEAPLRSLCLAFILGVWVARRR
jgi:hypothetical protein